MIKEIKKFNPNIYSSKAHPEKASTRVSINAFMMGSLFFILTLVWTLNPQKFSFIIISQLVLAIPLLFISSLAYSKVGYWKTHEVWDRFGWITNTIGNIFVMNVTGLITATIFPKLAIIYFALTIFLVFVYYLLNILYSKHTAKERILKFVLFLVIIYIGGINPLL
jgi:hypothetical protein